MDKRYIGIDIGSLHSHAVQLAVSSDGLCVEKTFSTEMRRDTDSPQQFLRNIFAELAFDRRADVAVAVPPESVFFRTVEADSQDGEKVRVDESFAVERNFPVEPGRAVCQAYPYHRLEAGKYRVLTAATKTDALADRLKLLTEAKIKPILMDASVFAIHSVVIQNYPETESTSVIVVHLDKSHFTAAIADDNKIIAVRKLPIESDRQIADLLSDDFIELAAREVRFTWQRVFGESIREGTRLYLVAESSVCEQLESAFERLGCRTVVVEPFARVKVSPQCKADASVAVAEGLALRLASPEIGGGVNFLKAYKDSLGAKANLKRELLGCAALIGAIFLVWVSTLFVRVSYYKSKHSQITGRIKEVFENTLPEEKNIVNPLVQLDRKLETLRADCVLFGALRRAGPLEILHTISTSLPTEANIQINEMLVGSESVRLTGTGNSFESIYDWQRQLEKNPMFSAVEIQDIRTVDTDNVVFFNLLIWPTASEQT